MKERFFLVVMKNLAGLFSFQSRLQSQSQSQSQSQFSVFPLTDFIFVGLRLRSA